MVSDRPTTTIGDLIAASGGEIKTGPFGTVLKAAEYSAKGVPIISVREIGDGHLVVLPETPRVPENVTRRLPQYLLRGGDIVFARKGAVERSALVAAEQEGWFLGSDCIRLRLPPICDPRFVRYQLMMPSHRNWMVQYSTGTTMPSLNQGIIGRIPIVLPDIREQRAIANILGVFDDKIELNRELNHTAEGIARALFRSWFVDFDPVVASAGGRQPFGVSSDVAALFPDAFVNTDHGPIPQTWSIGTPADLARYVNGRNFTNGASGTGRMVIRIAELNSGPGPSTVYSDASAAADNTASPGDLLFSWSGSLGVYRWSRDEALINQHIFKVVSEAFPQWFVHQQLLETLPYFQGVAADKATTMGHIKREHLSMATMAIPPSAILAVANDIVSPLYQTVLANERQSFTLAAIRDALLPRLLSGALRVGQAEKLVEHAV
jgi:type I restriction enzyme S subunit